MKGTVFQLATWLTCVTTIAAQSLVSTLEARPELVLFNGYIQSIPTLLNTLTNITNYTLLAPSDTAITRWLNTTSPSPNQDEIEATLNYHILHGGYALASISATPQFASSYLSNSSFTNVTGGALVELLEDGRSPTVLSGNKTKSSIITGDLTANGGLFHIVDTVLAIPEQELATATEAGMEYYIDIITKGGYLTGNANEINNALVDEPDMTFFIPNTAAASNNFTSITAGWTTDKLNALLVYHAVPGILVYSSTMRNGTVLPTVQGGAITIYVEEDGSMYANNVRILETDYLISNGVMHTIDGVLNPYNITRPVFQSLPSTKKATLSTGAIIGIAVASVLVLFAILGSVFLYRRRSKQATAAKATKTESQQTPTRRAESKSSEKTSRKTSNRSTGARVSDNSHRNHSKRSTTTTTTTASERSSRSARSPQIGYDKTRVEVDVRRVVGEQLDAFRRSGYYDPPRSPRSPRLPQENRATSAVPAVSAVELDGGNSVAGRHELFGGDPPELPVIEEETPKEISRASSRAMILDRR